MADSELRQRKPQDAEEPVQEVKVKKSTKSKVRDADAESPWVDVLRVISFLFVASCALSYWISNGESFFWGMKNKPNYLRVDWWKAQMQGPVYLTPEQLAGYDGKDPSKPVYVALNGTIYDVSNGRKMYGPGGPYSYFAGCDAARGFVTGCFSEDRTPDMRGVEDMFLPLDDPEVDAQWTTAEMKAMKEKEMAAALKKVDEALGNWVKFFANSKKYHKVGYVKKDENWLDKEPRKKLCEAAQQGRSKRKNRNSEY
ncbi:uncharacterized protein TrAFT101_003567 [Trichoderma asperellum]|uniref:Cytochrome b5 heme-binding domain-containing protein n=1 Tax=Trichoderma asperellum (strain ATCC 204424 / CBS 433.97 / NBRC 101777) TaxID=1042311 RepID=A0A2T3ZQC5_TRIA4|nr:hypothetical protein M441DRAFT_42732 [Trichoderma asperellum CBS 433.97]PTB46999.1 hypothetical protein M441DRAFT_42732 [Trichoderma asperellum CBS 433.97]UKZ87792.1 hypothetical protein TrAFT101_003567 [Trichoderma asperellum]